MQQSNILRINILKMKISEDDLKSLFDPDDIDLGPNEGWRGFSDIDENEKDKQENIKIKKIDTEKGNIDEIRTNIRNIKEDKQKLQNHHQKKASFSKINWILKIVASAGFSGFIIFLLINSPPYLKKFQYSYYTEYLGKPIPGAARARSQRTRQVSLPQGQTSVSPQPGQSSTSISSQPSGAENGISDNTSEIYIDRIGVRASIIWNVEEDQILKTLKDGVAHYKGTSLPGAGGNVFIVGHSSNYFWIRSDYNDVFALLDKLNKGDKIVIDKNGTNYNYTVTEKKIVSPDDVSVLNNTNKEVLSLMTCWPVGTNINRLVVISELSSIQ